MSRTAYTDAGGRFRFDDLTAGGSYRLRLASPSKKSYRLSSKPSNLTLSGADIANTDLAIVPKWGHRANRGRVP